MDKFERLQAKPQLSGPKRQHYISQFYLEGFADDRKLLQVFDRQTGEIRHQTPKDTAVIGHFYTFTDKDDRRRFDLEKLFDIIETSAGLAIKKIDMDERLSHEDREYLALFIAMTAIRTPAALEEARHIKKEIHRNEIKLRMADKKQAYELAKAASPLGTNDQDLRKLVSDMSSLINEDCFTVDVPDDLARQTSLKQWTPIAETIYNRDWTVVEAPNGFDYITSDSPVVLVPLEKHQEKPLGYGSLHAHILFPLSRKRALVMNGDEGRFRRIKARPHQVQNFNSKIAADCYRFVIGTQAEHILQTVEKSDLMKNSWSPRNDIDIATHPITGNKLIRIRGRGKRN